jgi:hypothetical protein
VADQQFIDQVDGPEDIMDDQQQDRMIVMPAYQQRVDTQDAVENARIPVVHNARLRDEYNKKNRPKAVSLLK